MSCGSVNGPRGTLMCMVEASWGLQGQDDLSTRSPHNLKSGSEGTSQKVLASHAGPPRVISTFRLPALVLAKMIFKLHCAAP